MIDPALHRLAAGRLLRRVAACLLGFHVLAACATQEGYRQVVQSWVGSHTDALVLSWGPPDSSYRLSDGRTVLQYDERRVVQTGGFTSYEPAIVDTGDGVATTYVPVTSPPTLTMLRCVTRFIADQNAIVRSFSFEGSACVAVPPS